VACLYVCPLQGIIYFLKFLLYMAWWLGWTHTCWGITLLGGHWFPPRASSLSKNLMHMIEEHRAIEVTIKQTATPCPHCGRKLREIAAGESSDSTVFTSCT
jgi:hypothetical protein